MTTLVAIGNREFSGRTFTHGEEIPPNLLPPEAVDWAVDRKWAHEYDSSERRSLYRIFFQFSGATEKEQLDREELSQFALPP